MQEKTLLVTHLGTNYTEEVGVTPPSPPQDVFSTTPPPNDDFIESVLQHMGIHYTRDRDNDLYAQFSGKKPAEDLHCWFLLNGHTRTIFQFSCMPETTISAEKWPDALQVCNTYNKNYRFGRLLLHVAEGQKEAKLYLEGQIDVTEGISEALLQSFIATHLACACDFFSKDPFHKVPLRKPKPRRKAPKNGDEHISHSNLK